MLIKTALNRALKGVVLDERDGAAVELARLYARLLDDDQKETRHIGPRLVEVLIELGMTPKSRTSVLRGGVPNGGSGSALDELRTRRERRTASQHGSTS